MSKRLKPVTIDALRSAAGLCPIEEAEIPIPPGAPGKFRGAASERRAFHAAEALVAQIPWLESVRYSTEEEDGEGKDLVIHADTYVVYVQVKSRRAAAKIFARTIKVPESKRGWLYGQCIISVAGSALTTETIMLEMLVALVQHRGARARP